MPTVCMEGASGHNDPSKPRRGDSNAAALTSQSCNIQSEDAVHALALRLANMVVTME